MLAPTALCGEGVVIMGAQKRRRSVARSANHRAHWKLIQPTLVECPQCHAQMRPHRVCPSCGYYAGRKVIALEESEKKPT